MSDPRVAVVGAGSVGVRCARDLLVPDAGAATGSEGPPSVAILTRRSERRAQLASSFGSQGVVIHEPDRPLAVPGTVQVVVVAREAGAQLPVARRALAEGRHVVCTTDDPVEVRELLELGERSVGSGLTLVAGAAMSPGLSCLLADHARDLFDSVDEVHVARHGAAGPACARQRLRSLRRSGLDWRDGSWVRRAGFSGRELDWFPDPIGARDCYRADLCEPVLLQPLFPEARRITARLAASRRDRALAPFPVLVPPPEEGGLGAVRVELRGRLGGERVEVVYGALDRPAVAAAAVAAVTARHLLQRGGPGGAGGVASLGASLELLAELARRGVRSAAFEGAAARDGR